MKVPQNLIIEADGGSRGNPGLAGSGACIIDADSGEVILEISKFIGVATNNVAEYIALVSGLEGAYQLNPQARILVRMDSKLVIEQMAGRWKIKHPDMQQLGAKVQSLVAAKQVRWQWIPREENSRADALANKAMDEQGDAQVSKLADSPKSPVVELGSCPRKRISTTYHCDSRASRPHSSHREQAHLGQWGREPGAFGARARRCAQGSQSGCRNRKLRSLVTSTTSVSDRFVTDSTHPRHRTHSGQ